MQDTKRRNTLLSLAAMVIALLVGGCAITDYDGIPGHRTTAEAKLWGQEVSFDGFGPDYDGTYSYTVRYTEGGPVTISSYRNPVVGSFTRDGLVDQDGDDVQGNGGILGGKFLPRFVAVDANPGVCDFDLNVTQDKSALGPGVYYCITGYLEEIDKDFELHASFASIDSLLSQIWSGALSGDFTLELTGIAINGAPYAVDAVSIGASVTSLRPNQFSIENQRGIASLIQTLLANTEHMVPVSLGLTFDGGMTVELPSRVTVAFDHDALRSLL